MSDDEHKIQLVIANRRTGKTTHAIDWYLKEPHTRVIAVASFMERKWLLEAIKERFKGDSDNLPESVRNGRAVMSVSDAMRIGVPNPHGMRGHGHTTREVYVDNIDLVLEMLFGNVVSGNIDAEMEFWHRESGQRAMWNKPKKGAADGQG